jgi:hypothetical protein
MIGTAEAVKTYAFAIGEGGEILNDQEATLDAGQELDKQAKEYAATFGKSYSEAFYEVLSFAENAELKEAYVGVARQTQTRLYNATPGEAGVEVDRLIREYINTHGCDYSSAYKRVLADPANADLVAEYGS